MQLNAITRYLITVIVCTMIPHIIIGKLSCTANNLYQNIYLSDTISNFMYMKQHNIVKHIHEEVVNMNTKYITKCQVSS